jgi:predicted DNA-binding protein YlxM (UPF0122 family)
MKVSGLTTLFSWYIGEVIKEWQINSLDNFLIDDSPLNTLLFADDQIIFANAEDNIQRSTFTLNKTANKRTVLQKQKY